MQLPAHGQNLPTFVPGEIVASLARHLGRDAEVYKILEEQGILVRLFEDIYCLHITIGKTEEMEFLLGALREI